MLASRPPVALDCTGRKQTSYDILLITKCKNEVEIASLGRSSGSSWRRCWCVGLEHLTLRIGTLVSCGEDRKYDPGARHGDPSLTSSWSTTPTLEDQTCSMASFGQAVARTRRLADPSAPASITRSGRTWYSGRDEVLACFAPCHLFEPHCPLRHLAHPASQYQLCWLPCCSFLLVGERRCGWGRVRKAECLVWEVLGRLAQQS